MFDMMKMLGKMKEVQAKMKDIQENLVHIKVTSEAGAGMVKATVNGKKQLISLEIARTKLLHGLPSTSKPMSVSDICYEEWYCNEE